MQHARELAREACDNGEICAAMGGDGIVGAVAGELRDGAGLLAVLPGGRGNDFARKLGIPFDPVEAAALLEDGEEKRIDLAEADGTTYLGILSAGIDSDVSRIALETRLKLGTFVYTYGVLRAIAGWKQAAWDVTIDGEPASFDGYSVAVANSGVFGGGMYLAPDAELDDGLLEVVMISAQSKLRYLRGLPRVFNGTPPAGSRGHARAGQGDHVPRRPAVHRVRRRRPDRRPAADGRACCRARCGWWRRDDPARRRRGRRQGGRHARAHRRARRRDVAAREGAHPRRAARDRPPREPAGARQRRDQRHQRQDHDGGDGGEDPRAHRRAARPQPRRREHGRRRRQRAGVRLTPRRPRR